MEKQPLNESNIFESKYKDKNILNSNGPLVKEIGEKNEIDKERLKKLQLCNEIKIALTRKKLNLNREIDSKEELTSIVSTVNSLSAEELSEEFSTKQLLEILDFLPTYFEDGEIPESVLDAEARIYSTYKPSEALQNKHKEVNYSAIESYNPKNLFILKEKWETINYEQKIDFIKGYIKKLVKNYDLKQDVAISIYDNAFDNESAMWLPSYEKNKVGSIILYKSVLEKSNFSTVISDISHELAHGFQEYIQKNNTEQVSENLLNDADWFKAYQNRHNEKNNYTEAYKSSDLRYRVIPLEQDAWSMQLYAYNELNMISQKYADELLISEGMISYSDIKKQSSVANWVIRKLKETTSTEDLIQEADKVAKNFPDFYSSIINFISNKNMEEISVWLKSVEDQNKKANFLLGLTDK